MAYTSLLFAAAVLATAPLYAADQRPIWSEMPPAAVAVESEDAESVWSALAPMSAEERRARFEAASPALKASLWRVHIRRFLADHPDLTPQQRQLLHEAIDLAAPELFAQPLEAGDRQVSARLEEFSSRARSVFTRDFGAAAFGRLGPRYRGPKSTEANEGGEQPPFDDGNPPTMGSCDCNVWDDWCGLMYKCVGGGCYWRSWGCGTMWTKSCTGLCIIYDGCTCSRRVSAKHD